MLQAGEKEAIKQSVPMAMAICDSGGNLVAFHRMDNSMLASNEIAINKAFTAVFGMQSTVKNSLPYRAGTLIPSFFHERWITFPGGFPIIKDHMIVGGLGVSGGVIEDIYVARAALLAGGFNTAEADQFIEECESADKKQSN
jgi:uncharacterized protein GlcG (DUF336 family)